MGIWEEQSNDLAQRKQSWESKQNFNFNQALLDSENEEEVKSAYVRHFYFPVKTGKRHDLTVNNVLFEFKYSIKFNHLEVAAKVVAQTIYYIHRLFESGEENLISHFIIADKDEAIIFKTSDFEIFYKSNSYDWKGYRPSSPDPKLINHLKQSRIIESSRIYDITDQADLELFTKLLYRIINNQNKDYIKPRKTHHKKLILIFTSLIILLSLGTVYFTMIHNQSPTKEKPLIIKNKP